MAVSFDLVIRGGLVVDGGGGAPFTADVAITGDKIAAIGAIPETGREEIDARGKLVTPGFVDIHTHYDGQLIWASEMSPSSAHGVTTVVTGNCGVGFAPCRPQDRDQLIKLLEGVEDMPEIVLAEGLPWDWETFPEYVAALQRRPHDIDFAVQLPHAALRYYVMGPRAVDGSQATAADLAEMRRLAREAVETGAIGFGTSRNIFHMSNDGVVIPTAHSPEAELKAIAEGMVDAGGGVIQAILALEDPVPDFEMFRRVAAETNSPFSFSLFQVYYDKDNWKELLNLIARANENGPPVTGQIMARPIGILLGLDASFNPFSAYPTYAKLADLPLAARVAELRKPEIRAAILGEKPEKREQMFFSLARRYEAIYPLGEVPNYEPDASSSIAAQAQAQGIAPEQIAYDLLLEQDGHALLLLAATNYENKNLDDVRTMLVHPNTVPALGDGGAHYGTICDSTYTTFMLTHWGRDRQHGRLPMPEIIAAMTSRPAAMMGMTDRGRITVGLKADINVIDFDNLALHAPRMVSDLPSGGRRLTQGASGYIATIVSGTVIQRNGRATGALPGRMVARSALEYAPLAAE
jgi:N-acyl-D-aspartate/D-glutamate deacylase